MIDPVLAEQAFLDDVASSLDRSGVLHQVRLHAGASPAMVEELSVSTGKCWSLAFIDGDHEDEALNPGHFEGAMHRPLRAAVLARRESILERYRDEHGCRRPKEWFDRKLDEFSTYYGGDSNYNGINPADVKRSTNVASLNGQRETGIAVPDERQETNLATAGAWP